MKQIITLILSLALSSYIIVSCCNLDAIDKKIKETSDEDHLVKYNICLTTDKLGTEHLACYSYSIDSAALLTIKNYYVIHSLNSAYVKNKDKNILHSLLIVNGNYRIDIELINK